jgi:putative ABC transport system permease protein
MPGLADDRAAYEAVLADPSLAIVSDFFLQESGGPPSNRLRAGDTFTAIDPVSGAKRQLTAAAITTNDWTFNGVLVGRRVAAELLGTRGVDNRHYVAVADGADPDVVAERLTASLLGNGADARTFLDEIEGELAEQQGFFRLMQGYLALGLAIGVAGLGVVMVRAVRERRRQVGMLRAMGFQARTVRRAFLVEAAFIAFQGVAIGIGLGLLTSYQVLSKSATFGDQPLPFSVPWGGLAILFVLPLLAAMAATVAPAAQAAAIRPAAALRISE